MIKTPLAAAFCAAFLTACSSAFLRPEPAGTVTAPSHATVAETWISLPSAAEELDSLAIWRRDDGRAWIIATAKSSQQLIVYDSETGQRLRVVGGPGDAPGRFGRPNGIDIHGDIVFVVERDNRRVQLLRLPDFVPLGSFGEQELRTPYGLWLWQSARGTLHAYVTDSFMTDFKTQQLPPMPDLAQRVKRYEIRPPANGVPQARYLGAFGDTGPEGALRMVESIAGDPEYDRLLIAEEDQRVGSTLRDYSLSGRYRGTSLPPFEGHAEGIALWACGADAGYWIAVDQTVPSLFRVYERDTLHPAGSFSGRQVADTDGIALSTVASPRFPHGALYAQHNNQAVAAFDLGQVVRSLALSRKCLS